MLSVKARNFGIECDELLRQSGAVCAGGILPAILEAAVEKQSLGAPKRPCIKNQAYQNPNDTDYEKQHRRAGALVFPEQGYG